MTVGVAIAVAFDNFTVFSHGVRTSTASLSCLVTVSGMPVEDNTALARANADGVEGRVTATVVVAGTVVGGRVGGVVGTTTDVLTSACWKRGCAVPHAART